MIEDDYRVDIADALWRAITSLFNAPTQAASEKRNC
jgi:hypothetical protein